MSSLQNNAALANGPITPLSMSVLDSLTVHAKMSLIHSIVSHVIKSAQSKGQISLPPALVETYSRLLVYTEIESLGIKGFISNLKKNYNFFLLITKRKMRFEKIDCLFRLFNRPALTNGFQISRLGHSLHAPGDVQLPNAPHPTSL